MKAEDLMIGDWVRMKENQKIAFQMEDISGTGMFKRWTSDGEYMIPYAYDEIEPIPLTPEILEKNLKEFIPGLNCMYELGGPYCISLEKENCWVFGLATKAARYPMVKIRYVHELQHALKLCRINLEIRL